MEKLEVFTIKVNFAGSGDEVWRKAVHSIDSGDLSKLSDAERKKVQEEVMKGVPHKQKGILIIDKKQGYFLGKTCKDMYGYPFVKDNYVYYFKYKPNKNQVTYTIPGVDGPMFQINGQDVENGIKDVGEYSIKNTTEKVVPQIEHQIDNVINDILRPNKNSNNKIVVWIKGHSRGGVSASFLLKTLERKYKKYIEDDRILVCISQFDPVPGKKKSWCQEFSDRSKNAKYADPAGYEEFELDKLSEKIKSAVVFSINPGYGPANDDFTMQKVRGAKVIIITPEDHAVGLYKTGTDDKKRGYEFKYEVDGVELTDIVSPGKLWQLKSGIYWAKNNDTKQIFELTKIDKDNYEEYIKELSSSKVSQYRRNFLTGLIYNDKDINNFITPKIEKCFKKENLYTIIQALKDEFNKCNDKAFVKDLESIEISARKYDARSLNMELDDGAINSAISIESALGELDEELKNCKIKKYVLGELEKILKEHQKV